MTHNNDNGRPDFDDSEMKNPLKSLQPPADGDAVGELRDCLDLAEPGDAVLVGTRTHVFEMPWTVREVTRTTAGLEIILDGARGATYRFRDDPETMDRPEVDYRDPRDGWQPAEGKKDGELWSVAFIAGYWPEGAVR